MRLVGELIIRILISCNGCCVVLNHLSTQFVIELTVFNKLNLSNSIFLFPPSDLILLNCTIIV